MFANTGMRILQSGLEDAGREGVQTGQRVEPVQAGQWLCSAKHQPLQLRYDRLQFYKEDIERIDKILGEFLRLSGAKCALLVDKDGHMVTKRGEVRTIDMDTISALVAGSFAATKEMARLLGEQEFSALFHQGERDNIQLSLVGDRTLLTILFDDRTTVGMVRLYASETSKKLEQVYEDCMEKMDERGDPDLGGPGAPLGDLVVAAVGPGRSWPGLRRPAAPTRPVGPGSPRDRAG